MNEMAGRGERGEAVSTTGELWPVPLTLRTSRNSGMRSDWRLAKNGGSLWEFCPQYAALTVVTVCRLYELPQRRKAHGPPHQACTHARCHSNAERSACSCMEAQSFFFRRAQSTRTGAQGPQIGAPTGLGDCKGAVAGIDSATSRPSR